MGNTLRPRLTFWEFQSPCMVMMVPCSCVAFLCPEPSPKWFLLSDLLRAKISQFPRHVKAIQARIVMNLQLYDHIIGSHGARLATPRGRFDLIIFSPHPQIFNPKGLLWGKAREWNLQTHVADKRRRHWRGHPGDTNLKWLSEIWGFPPLESPWRQHLCPLQPRRPARISTSGCSSTCCSGAEVVRSWVLSEKAGRRMMIN